MALYQRRNNKFMEFDCNISTDAILIDKFEIPCNKAFKGITNSFDIDVVGLLDQKILYYTLEIPEIGYKYYFVPYTKNIASLSFCVNKEYPSNSITLVVSAYDEMGSARTESKNIFLLNPPIILPPVFKYPIKDEVLIHLDKLLIQLETMQVENGEDALYSTDYIVATDDSFTNIIASSINDTKDVYSKLFTNLSLEKGSEVYIKCRFKGRLWGYSEFSSCAVSVIDKDIDPPDKILDSGQPDWDNIKNNYATGDYNLYIDTLSGALGYVGRPNANTSIRSGDGIVSTTIPEIKDDTVREEVYLSVIKGYPSGTYDIYMVPCGNASNTSQYHGQNSQTIIEKYTHYLDGITPIILTNVDREVIFNYGNIKYSVDNRLIKRNTSIDYPTISGDCTLQQLAVRGIEIKDVWTDRETPPWAIGGRYFWKEGAYTNYEDIYGMGCGGHRWDVFTYLDGKLIYSSYSVYAGGPAGIILFRIGD